MPSKYTKTPGGVFVPGEQYTYESSEIFLSMVQAEYQNEIDRSAALDSKLGISLPVIATYFFLIIQETDIDSLWNFKLDTGISLPELFVMLLYPITVITAVISLSLMIRAVMTRNYMKIDIRDFYNAKEMSRPKEQFSAIMPNYYIHAIELNRVQNSKRANEYREGWVFGIVSLVYFSVYTSVT